MKAARILLALMLVGLMGCSGGNSLPNNGAILPDLQNDQTGHVLASAVIGPDGGSLSSSTDFTSRNAVYVEFPQGALDGNYEISLLTYKVSPVMPPNPEGVQTSDVFLLTSDQPVLTTTPITITIPYDQNIVNHPELLMGGFISKELKLLRALGIESVDRERGTITVKTYCLGDFAIFYWDVPLESVIPQRSVNLEVDKGNEPEDEGIGSFNVDSGFRPVPDGFFIPNFRSYFSEEGNCMGMACYTAWYYIMRTNSLIDDDQGLYYQDRQGFFDHSFEDCTVHEIADRAHREIDPIWAQILFQFENSPPNSLVDDIITRNSIIAALGLLQQPQVLTIYTNSIDWLDFPFLLSKGHTVTVYKYESGRFFLYDSNFPGVVNSLKFDVLNGFKNYQAYTQFNFNPIDTYLNGLNYLDIYEKSQDGFAGNSLYPDLQITSHADGQEVYSEQITLEGIIANVLLPDVQMRLDVFVNDISNKYSINSLESPFSLEIPLQPGNNWLVIFADENDDNVDHFYAAIKELTIHYLPDPQKPTAIAAIASDPPYYAGETISFDGSQSHDNDENGEKIVQWVWHWDDGTPDKDDTDAYAGHVFNQPGTYDVTVWVKDDEGQGDLSEVLEVVVSPQFIPEGGNLIWAKRAGGFYSSTGYDISTLSDNSTVVTGYFDGTLTFGQDEPNQTELTSAGQTDIFIARYHPDGSFVWAKRVGGSKYDYSWSITSIQDDCTVITGYFSGTVIFGQGDPNQTELISEASQDIFIAKYNSEGMLVWAKRAGGSMSSTGYGVTSLSDGSIIITGWYLGTVMFGQGESNQTQLSSTGGSDIFIARFHPDGSLVWVTSAGGSDLDRCYRCNSLSDNSIVTTGFFDGTATFGQGEPNQTVLVSSGWTDMFVAGYYPNGYLAWAKRVGGSNSDRGEVTTTLSDNSTVVTGYFGSTVTFGQGEPNEISLSTAGATDILIARYNSDGNLIWATSAGGSQIDYGTGVSALSNDSPMLIGQFAGTATFGQGETNQTILTTTQGWNHFIARYNPDGSLAWAKRICDSFADYCYGVTTLSDNSSVITGSFAGSTIFGEGEPNETFFHSLGSDDVFIARYEP